MLRPMRAHLPTKEVRQDPPPVQPTCSECNDTGKVDERGSLGVVHYYCSCYVGQFLFGVDVRALLAANIAREVYHA